MENKILLLGAGGHFKSVVDTLVKIGSYSVIGYIEKEMCCEPINNVQCVGTDDDLEKLHDEGWTDAFITVGSVGDVKIRKKLYRKIKEIGFQIPVIIDETAVISPLAVIGEGTFIGKNVVINAETKIGINSIINSSSVVEHECIIGDFCHISSNSTLCGNCFVDNYSHIGAGSVIKQGTKIGSNVLIGIGSVVTKDIGNNVIAYGNPCKVMKNK